MTLARLLHNFGNRNLLSSYQQYEIQHFASTPRGYLRLIGRFSQLWPQDMSRLLDSKVQPWYSTLSTATKLCLNWTKMM